jgi:DNA-binding NtrC family response regulator
MNRARVLVVEDRPSVLKLLTTILSSTYEVTTASTGSGALALLDTAIFDVVLTDVRMPGASGFDVLRALRDRSPTTRVVMLTAYANVADAVAAIRLGAYDYVAKPLDPSEISLVVARAAAHLRESAEECEDSANVVASRSGAPNECEDLALGFHRAVEEARRRASRNYLVLLMRLHEGNVTHAAKQAGMTRESLHRVLRQYGVSPEQHREPAAEGLTPHRAAR